MRPLQRDPAPAIPVFALIPILVPRNVNRVLAALHGQHRVSSAEGPQDLELDPIRSAGSSIRAANPTAHCELDHRSPFELLGSLVILSAQTTDVGVNKATPKLFARYPDAKALAAADPLEVGLAVSTSRLLPYQGPVDREHGGARGLVNDHGGEVPWTMEELVELPRGVGKIGQRGSPARCGNELRRSRRGHPRHAPQPAPRLDHGDRAGEDRGGSVQDPPAPCRWAIAGYILIFHGRRCCFARKPRVREMRRAGACARAPSTPKT